MSTQNLGRSTIAGLLWLSIQSLGARFVSVFTQLFLAKLLLPADFGVISIVYIITSIAATLTDFGVQGVVLQRFKSLRLWVTPAFWASFSLGFAGFLVVLIGAPLLGRLYHSPTVAHLATIFAVSMPIAALSTVPSIRMRRDLNFRFPALYGMIENFAIQFATVALAFEGFGALSFVLPVPVFALVKSAVFWYHSPVNIRGAFKSFQFKYLIGNGSTIFGSSLLTQLISQGDYATLGLFADKATVGFYYFAFRLAAQPVWIMAGNLTNVLFPALVQIQNDPERQINATMKAAKLLAYLIMPICFGQAMLSSSMLSLFFGHKWDSSIQMMVLLSIGIPFDAACWIGGCILGARRQFKRRFVITLVALPSFFISVLIGSYFWGAVGTAASVAFYYLAYGPIYSFTVFRSLGAKSDQIVDLYVRAPLISGTAMLSSWVVFNRFLPIQSDLIRICDMGCLGVLLFCALMSYFAKETLFDIMKKVGIDRTIKAISHRRAYVAHD